MRIKYAKKKIQWRCVCIEEYVMKMMKMALHVYYKDIFFSSGIFK